jgi:para-aminobenzoate synthetase
MTHTLLVDNYDSFTYNLYDLLASVNSQEPTVVVNDFAWEGIDLDDYDNIVISPGPGRPDTPGDVGISRRLLSAGLPLLGVCLGHQLLGHAFGARVQRAAQPVHGRISMVRHDGLGLFAGIPSPMQVVRYHSLIVTSVSDPLMVTARSTGGAVMALRHRTQSLWGVQFHPESIGTEHGRTLIENFHALTSRRPRASTSTPTIRPTSQSSAGRFRLHHRRVDGLVDPEQVYRSLFADNPVNFWLDRSAHHDADSRFSILGDAGGRYGEYLTYSVEDTLVTARSASGLTRLVRRPLLHYLKDALRSRTVTADPALPFDFHGGYIGYLGYELKAHTGGDAAHRAEQPDASLVFADRAVVIDHDQDCCYALCLTPAGGDCEALTWLADTEAHLQTLTHSSLHAECEPEILTGSAEFGGLSWAHDRDAYLELIAECQALIRWGQTYEVCLTNLATADMAIDPVHAFTVLRRANPVPYSSLLRFDDLAVVSASPEQFLRVLTDRTVQTQPIKGTRPRSADPEHDAALRADLANSVKDRAENLMIVDLMRNDLARVCETGSIQVRDLFCVSTFPSAHQMISTVGGRLRFDRDCIDLITAAFPPGSITGAPKRATMTILDQLEQRPRGVYTGALGYLSLSGTADLAVAIRTLTVTPDQVAFGAGGAITALSDPVDEVDEVNVKSAVLQRIVTMTEEAVIP